MSLRHVTKQFNPMSGAAATIDPADFVRTIDNPYFPLVPGTTFISETPDGSSVDTFVVTRRTIDILGVTCVVVEDTVRENGELKEKTFDYFAQDKRGNVWYFGEDTKEFENGKVVSTAGTWRAGVDGATPGFIMLADPRRGDEYDQEHAPGVAEDHAEVLRTNASLTVPYGSFDNVLKTAETTPLEPDVLEHKFHAPGVGFLLAFDVNENERMEQLVKIKIDGTAKDETLVGNLGPDELNGLAGDDRLNGAAGADTLKGGLGDDTLEGGRDRVADLIYGGGGGDEIGVGARDQAWGGPGDDLLHLFDTTGFGSLDGGDQLRDNLRWTRGDVLEFDGRLDLARSGVSDRVEGIETLSMADGRGDDRLRLDLRDLLDLGDGEFNPAFRGADRFGEGDALRVDGDKGDRLALTGGDWDEITPTNAPDGYSVLAFSVGAGDAYLLVQDEIAIVTA
jgi:hypothetical protein